MRSELILVGCICMGLAQPASAQSPFDGPLASPDAPAAKPVEAPAKHAKAKSRKPRHASAESRDARSRSAVPFDRGGPAPYERPTAAATPRESPADPLSLGMKWQGNNDTAAETRSQNLDGSAFGSGAEVGMKLHF